MKQIEALLVAPRKIELREREIPHLGKNDLLVEVVSCGVCSSETPVYLGETDGIRGVSFRYAKFPCFLGHEVAGIVIDMGSEVPNFKQGDRVTGVAYSRSGFATHIIEPAQMFVKVPASIPLEFALGEPIMAVCNIVRMAAPDFGDSIFMAGDGFMSLLTIAALKHYPLKSLIVSGHHENRLALARNLGATHIINSRQEDAYWQTRKIIDGDAHDPEKTKWENGVDIAFDFTGSMEALQLCASLCKPKQRARLMMPSFYRGEPFSLGHYLMNRAPSLIPCHPAHSNNIMNDLQRGLWAMDAGIFKVNNLITHAYSLENITSAINSAITRYNGYIKGIIVPKPEYLENFPEEQVDCSE